MKNRLLKVCYVLATCAGHPRLLFFLFLVRPLTVLMKQTRQAGRALKQSISLRTLCYLVIETSHCSSWCKRDINFAAKKKFHRCNLLFCNNCFLSDEFKDSLNSEEKQKMSVSTKQLRYRTEFCR